MSSVMQEGFSKFVWFFILIVSGIYFTSCKSGTRNIGDLETYLWSKYQDEEIKKSLISRFDTLQDTFLVCHTEIEYFDTLKDYYAQNGFRPIWTEHMFKEGTLDTILAVLDSGWVQGLDSNMYDITLIRFYLDGFYHSMKKDTLMDYNKLANIEILVSNALLRYTQDMKYGMLNPQKVFPLNYELPLKIRDSSDLFNVLKTDHIGKFLKELAPHYKPYVALQKQLRRYTAIMKKGGWDTIPCPDKQIRIDYGDTSEILKDIALRLSITGELDSNLCKGEKFETYDSLLFKSVVLYQQRNGLLDDGVIGFYSIKSMNVPVYDRIRQIALNMERFRWYEYPDSSCYVKVNIPEFMLYGNDSGEVKVEMKVCLGQKKDVDFDKKMKQYLKTKNIRNKPNNHETPNVFSNISHIILNPQWSVPTAIVEKEIYFLVLKDSNYLRDNNFKVFLDTVEIDQSSINWKIYKNGKVPFKFIQDAGELNALGKMKFVFYNKFDVYMHDTPNKPAFERAIRAVSHGCIRLEKPMEFAEFLIRGMKKLEMDDIRIDLGMKPEDDKEKRWIFKKKMEKYDDKQKELEEKGGKFEPSKIFLKRKVPVYVDYYTAWVDMSGTLQFRDDIYNRDKVLLEHIRRLR
jgi:murein L,D-transpeptidase YcbB/YkuD